VQSSSQIITTNKPTSSFLQAGCPSCHPTNSVKALKVKNITFHGLHGQPFDASKIIIAITVTIIITICYY